MGFVAQSAQERDTELICITVERLAFPWQEDLLALFGEGADREIFVKIQFTQCFHHCRELALTTIDHDHVWPVIESIGLQRTAPLMAQGSDVDAIGFGA